MSLQADTVDRNAARQHAIEQVEQGRTLRDAETIRELEIILVPHQQSAGVSLSGRPESPLQIIDAAVLEPKSIAQAIRPMTRGVQYFIHHIPGVQLTGEVPGYLMDVVRQHPLSIGRCEPRGQPRRQSVVP